MPLKLVTNCQILIKSNHIGQVILNCSSHISTVFLAVISWQIRASGSFVTAVAACMRRRLLAMTSFSICSANGTTIGTGAGCLRTLFFPMSLNSHVSINSNASLRSLPMRRSVPHALSIRQVHSGPWLLLWVIHHLLFLSSL